MNPMTTPAKTILGLFGAGLLASAALAAAEHGYTDTPFLPGTPWRVHDARRPFAPHVEPGARAGMPPSDAIVLFDGKDLSQWVGVRDGTIADGSFDIQRTGGIQTRQEFGDCQLHVEWATPAVPDSDEMNWGNSGVLLLGKYEVQIIQSEIYADGVSGAIYGQTPPLVYPMRPAGQWQVYDIVFTAPRFDGERLVSPAYFTVLWNGVLVQDHAAALGPTRHRELATYDFKGTRGPLVLQYHNSAVRFRNIWIRPIDRDGH